MEIMLIATVVLLAFSNTFQISAQISPPPPPATTTPAAQPPPTEAQEYLDAHNKARAEVGVGPLKWSDQLANSASLLVRNQRDKQGCQFANLSGRKYGGNQLFARGGTVAPGEVVAVWVAEKQFYSHANNSCAPDHQCGVYTQVVWRKSAELGCAQARCAKDQSSLTVCYYNPPGNVVGESPY